jgi:hypothetical protein
MKLLLQTSHARQRRNTFPNINPNHINMTKTNP